MILFFLHFLIALRQSHMQSKIKIKQKKKKNKYKRIFFNNKNLFKGKEKKKGNKRKYKLSPIVF